jgi:hypothetical protein
VLLFADQAINATCGSQTAARSPEKGDALQLLTELQNEKTPELLVVEI